MALSESKKTELDAIIIKAEATGADQSEILEIVADFTEMYDSKENDQDKNIEKAIAKAVDDGAAPAEIKFLQSMHSSYTPEERKQLVEESREMAINALPAGDRYKAAGMNLGETGAGIFETLFPYATGSMKKGASDTRIGAGAYADVSSFPGRVAVGGVEAGANALSNTVTGGTGGPGFKDAVSDIDRENIVTSTLTAPGTIESLAVGGILGSGAKALVPAAAKIPMIAGLMEKAPIKPIISAVEKGIGKIPFMGEKGLALPGMAESLATRAAPRLMRGGATALPSAATTQIRDYSRTGDFDTVEMGIETAAGAILDPAIEEIGTAAMKAGKSLAKGFLEKSSGMAEDVLEHIGLEEFKEIGSAAIKGTNKGFKSTKLKDIKNFGEKSSKMANEMVDRLENFHEWHLAEPGNDAYEALDDMDLIDIKPFREMIYDAKLKKAPPQFRDYVEARQGDFKEGVIPVGYKFGVPGIDAQMEKLDGLVKMTVSPEMIANKNRLVNVARVKDKLKSEKITPIGWKGSFDGDQVPFGHKFGDTKIDSHNRKVDEMMLQFGAPTGKGKNLELKDIKQMYLDNAKVGNKDKVKMLDRVFTDSEMYSKSGDLWHPRAIVDLRRKIDDETKHDIMKYGSMNSVNKGLRHNLRMSLEHAASTSGNKKYIPAMKELNEKIEIQDNLINMMNSRDDWTGKERFERFLLSLASEDKTARREFAGKLDKLFGEDFVKKAKLHMISKEYKNKLPIFNPIRTGAGGFAAQLFQETPLKWSGALLGGPKFAAPAYGAMNAATPAVKKAISTTRAATMPATSNLYEREN